MASRRVSEYVISAAISCGEWTITIIDERLDSSLQDIVITKLYSAAGDQRAIVFFLLRSLDSLVFVGLLCDCEITVNWRDASKDRQNGYTFDVDFAKLGSAKPLPRQIWKQ